jgi:hypothetical protein
MFNFLHCFLVFPFVTFIFSLKGLVFGFVLFENCFRLEEQVGERVFIFDAVRLEGRLIEVGDIELGPDSGGEVRLLFLVSAHERLHFEGGVDEV